MSDAILLAGEDRWTIERHGIGRSTRHDYETKGIPSREVADDLVDWFQGKRGEIKPAPAADLDITDPDYPVAVDDLRTIYRVGLRWMRDAIRDNLRMFAQGARGAAPRRAARDRIAREQAAIRRANALRRPRAQ